MKQVAIIQGSDLREITEKINQYCREYDVLQVNHTVVARSLCNDWYTFVILYTNYNRFKQK